VTLQEPRPRPRPSGRRRGLLPLVLVLAALAASTVALVFAAPGVEVGPGPPDAPPGLGDLWSGRASLVLDKKWTSTSLGRPGGGAYAGSHVEVVGDTWYLFHRRTHEEPCEGHGPGSRRMGTEVRASTDRGATWGPPATVVTPTPGTPWSCAASDGDAVYDAEAGTWHYLFQCQGATGGWHGCHLERRGGSPLGEFTAPVRGANPVIAPGQLWRRICDDPGDDCHRAPGQAPIADEGTFNVFGSDGERWWVGFHGWDGSQGFRGIARTSSFRRGDWQVDGAGGTPTDAVLDARDAAGWRESWAPGGPVGAGAASVLEDDGRYYQLAEVPDMSLGCTTGQNWNLGLFRAASLSSTEWEQYPGGNPIVYSSRKPDSTGSVTWCNVEYPGLFEDAATGTTYLMHGRISGDPANDGIYVYRLEWDRNLLFNGDFWRADAHGWKPREDAPAKLSVERDPDGSPDGTPYLSFNCGAPTCDAGRSVYQDVTVEPDLAGDRLAFGGSFRTHAGGGRLDAAVLQLGPAGEVIERTVVAVDATGAYAEARGELEVDPRARRLRFELYPRTPGTLRADNLYLITQDGCQAPRYPAC
jgi:hypothetical protein